MLRFICMISFYDRIAGGYVCLEHNKTTIEPKTCDKNAYYFCKVKVTYVIS